MHFSDRSLDRSVTSEGLNRDLQQQTSERIILRSIERSIVLTDRSADRSAVRSPLPTDRSVDTDLDFLQSIKALCTKEKGENVLSADLDRRKGSQKLYFVFCKFLGRFALMFCI